MSPTVIVFGPTGNVGSYVARTAHKNGAKVILAMRDTSKSIYGLSKEEEKQGNYKRVQADLGKTDTIKEAVKSTGATRAFIYLLHGNQDGMKSCLEALKSAGIEFVVFLSSFTIGPYDGEPRNVPKEEIIPYVHAVVEINLDEVFGQEHYVALRPGAFATTVLNYKNDINKGDIRLYEGDFQLDYVAANDMGEIGGTILATQTGPKNGQGKVYIYGPKFMTFREALNITADKLGKEIKITQIDREEAYQKMMDSHVPPVFANYLLNKQGQKSNPEKSHPFHKEGVDNVQKYLGRKATSLPEWVDNNLDQFKD